MNRFEASVLNGALEFGGAAGFRSRLRPLLVACCSLGAALGGCAVSAGESLDSDGELALEEVSSVAEALTPCANRMVPYRVVRSGGLMFAPGDFDGDGKADISAKTNYTNAGWWHVDLAANGFGSWDLTYTGSGNKNSVVVPADYDGDCKVDFAVKDNERGLWRIDFSRDGFGRFVDYRGYGGPTRHLVPADYDGDRRFDISIKGADGVWYLDYGSNGFGAWNGVFPAYGDDSATAVPADYDGDGAADLAIYSRGEWCVDNAFDGFGSWNNCPYIRHVDPSNSIPVPADYDGDGKTDLAVKSGTYWYIDYSRNGFSSYWDFRTSGHAGSTGDPVPADYDGDRKADIAVIAANGTTLIDYASNGFGVWDQAVPYTTVIY